MPNYRAKAAFCSPAALAAAMSSRWRSGISARSNAANVPITYSSKVAMGESSLVKVNCSSRNSTRTPLPVSDRTTLRKSSSGGSSAKT